MFRIYMVKPEAWMASVDLKDIYYSVPIHEEHQEYLKSLWEYPLKLIDISNSYKPAMTAFTKLLKLTFSFLRSDFF